ncbi:MAG: EAL domain-containing protein [Gammaproteobacteria bacterium]
MGSSLKVLIVEDNADDAEFIVMALRKGGYSIDYACVDTGEAMQSAIEQGTWDVVIADHSLPRFSSAEALQVLRQSGFDLPFLVVSGAIGEDRAVETMKAGAHDFIMKDNLARLVPAVERELREANIRRAKRQAEALLRYHANHDALTGLLNRREFELRLERALNNSRAESRRHALGYIDLDQFKLVNDTCGHVAGDELLKQLAALLRNKLRQRDTLARLGGDEFGLLLEDCDIVQAESVAQELLRAVRAFRFTWLEKSFEIGASIGLVAIEAGSTGTSELLSTADVACYVAKDLGRNRVHVYQPDDAVMVLRHGEMHWVSDITKALDESRFVLYHQDIRPLAAGTAPVRHFEVLVRMLDDNNRVVTPGAFIPAAERYNLMPAIDRWVVTRVFSLLARLRDLGGAPPALLATVNLSGTSISDQGFIGFVRNCAEETRLAPGSVCFEITETAAISNLNTAVAFITELKRLGLRFSLDDFGSGLSSFAYLKNLPVDFLKIDGSFIKDIVNDPIDRVMVDAINKIGHVMGLQTVAECVEDDDILATVTDLGVDFTQGFGIHRPAPLSLQALLPAAADTHGRPA